MSPALSESSALRVSAQCTGNTQGKNIIHLGLTSTLQFTNLPDKDRGNEVEVHYYIM